MGANLEILNGTALILRYILEDKIRTPVLWSTFESTQNWDKETKKTQIFQFGVTETKIIQIFQVQSNISTNFEVQIRSWAMEHSSFIDTLYTVSEIFVIGANTKVVDWIVGTQKHLHIWCVSQAYLLYLNSILWCTLINSVFIIFWEIKRYFPSAIHHWSKWMKMEIWYLGTEIWIVTTKIIAITMCELMHGGMTTWS